MKHTLKLCQFKNIIFDVTQNTARITLNRPEYLNALNVSTVHELTQAFDIARQDSAVRVAVLSGNGAAFSAGGDIEFMASLKGDYSRSLAFTQGLCEMFKTIYRFRTTKTLITQGHGASIGAASGIMAASDLVLVDNATRFGFPERRLKLIPATLAPSVVGRIGTENAKALFTSGEIFDASTALSIGLVHGKYEMPALHGRVEEMIDNVLISGKSASRIAVSPRTTLRHVSAIPKDIEGLVEDIGNLIQDKSPSGRERTYDYAATRLAEALITPEAQGAIAAFWKSKNNKTSTVSKESARSR